MWGNQLYGHRHHHSHDTCCDAIRRHIIVVPGTNKHFHGNNRQCFHIVSRNVSMIIAHSKVSSRAFVNAKIGSNRRKRSYPNNQPVGIWFGIVSVRATADDDAQPTHKTTQEDPEDALASFLEGPFDGRSPCKGIGIENPATKDRTTIGDTRLNGKVRPCWPVYLHTHQGRESDRCLGRPEDSTNIPLVWTKHEGNKSEDALKRRSLHGDHTYEWSSDVLECFLQRCSRGVLDGVEPGQGRISKVDAFVVQVLNLIVDVGNHHFCWSLLLPKGLAVFRLVLHQDCGTFFDNRIGLFQNLWVLRVSHAKKGRIHNRPSLDDKILQLRPEGLERRSKETRLVYGNFRQRTIQCIPQMHDGVLLLCLVCNGRFRQGTRHKYLTQQAAGRRDVRNEDGNNPTNYTPTQHNDEITIHGKRIVEALPAP
mmetsp:Transcript_7327/g.14562  ORF Transcript_7327/g.14562 Transcript_7327/m.14562 type:complete len:423 (+) Transcript_7327:2367-3635(+)